METVPMIEPGTNPLFDIWALADHGRKYGARRMACLSMAWAVPSEAALSMISKLSPIVEIGAGMGYWARMLSDRGANVIAYDKDPPSKRKNDFHGEWDECYFPVNLGDEAKVAEHKDRTLLLCWPPYSCPMASNCLRLYEGERVVFVGEDEGGCTADDDFFDLLDERFVTEETIDIPQWDGLHDYIRICRRKAKP